MLQKAMVQGQTIKVNDAEIYYEVRGDGPPLLFIVGSTGDAGTFAQVADLLADEFTVVTYDRRGNSRSPRPAGWVKTSVDEQGDDAAGLLKALDLAPALVYGNSVGAIIALNLVIRYPELVSRAILHEPPLLSILAQPDEPTKEMKPRIEQAMAAHGPRGAVEAFLRFVIGDAAFEQMDSQLRERLLNNGETLFGLEFGRFEQYVPSEREFAAINVPVQVMAGEESYPFFKEAAAWLAAQLHVKTVAMPGAHTPHRDRPQAMVDTVRPFLQRGKRG